MDISREFHTTPDGRYALQETDSKGNLNFVSGEVSGWAHHVASPKYDYYPLHPITGEHQLVGASPSSLDSLYKSPGASPQGVSQLLALMHQDAVKRGTGTLTYSRNLSRDSSALSLNALNKGYVEENPRLPKHILERDAKERRLVGLTGDRKQYEINRRESAKWEAEENVNKTIYGDDYQDHDPHFDSPDTLDDIYQYRIDNDEVHHIPEKYAEEAVGKVKEQAARTRYHRQKKHMDIMAEYTARPESDPHDEGTLFDHLPRKQRNEWNDFMGKPRVGRAGVFKNAVGGLVDRVRGR